MHRSSGLSSTLRKLHHVIFATSRAGRPAEIAAWSNAAASLVVGIGTYVFMRSWPLTIGFAVIAFVLLRGALTHRLTVWIAASFGTLAVGALGGGLAWLFAHVIDAPAVPSIAAVIVAVGSATVPAWAYANLADRRARNVRDSLIEPVSVPSSRS
jgi:hypothetical protein